MKRIVHLPPMPKERITFETRLPLVARLDNDLKRFSTGGLRMTFSDVCVRVYKKRKNGSEHEIGAVLGCLGGGLQVQIRGRAWYVDSMAIWRAIEEVDRRYARSIKVVVCPHGKTALIERTRDGLRRKYVTRSACGKCQWTSQRYVGSLFRQSFKPRA